MTTQPPSVTPDSASAADNGRVFYNALYDDEIRYRDKTFRVRKVEADAVTLADLSDTCAAPLRVTYADLDAAGARFVDDKQTRPAGSPPERVSEAARPLNGDVLMFRSLRWLVISFDHARRNVELYNAQGSGFKTYSLAMLCDENAVYIKRVMRKKAI